MGDVLELFEDYKFREQYHLYESIEQNFLFSENECRVLESCVNKVVEFANCGAYKPFTVDRAPLRNKYFFGEGYTYGSQMSQKGPGMERLYPTGTVDEIPAWITELAIKPLVNARLVPQNFINSAVINDYRPGGCIVSHIDPPHIFDRPIVSINLFSDTALCFGCKFQFKPIRCSEPVFRLGLPRGIVTLLKGYAADKVTHCIRPEDVSARRAAIVLRRVFPWAPRLSFKNCAPRFLDVPPVVMKKFSKKYGKQKARRNLGSVRY